jgi:hypothetical protein
MHYLLIWMQAHTARQEIMTVYHDPGSTANYARPILLHNYYNRCGPGLLGCRW